MQKKTILKKEKSIHEDLPFPNQDADIKDIDPREIETEDDCSFDDTWDDDYDEGGDDDNEE